MRKVRINSYYLSKTDAFLRPAKHGLLSTTLRALSAKSQNEPSPVVPPMPPKAVVPPSPPAPPTPPKIEAPPMPPKAVVPPSPPAPPTPPKVEAPPMPPKAVVPPSPPAPPTPPKVEAPPMPPKVEAPPMPPKVEAPPTPPKVEAPPAPPTPPKVLKTTGSEAVRYGTQSSTSKPFGEKGRNTNTAKQKGNQENYYPPRVGMRNKYPQEKKPASREKLASDVENLRYVNSQQSRTNHSRRAPSSPPPPPPPPPVPSAPPQPKTQHESNNAKQAIIPPMSMNEGEYTKKVFSSTLAASIEAEVLMAKETRELKLSSVDRNKNDLRHQLRLEPEANPVKNTNSEQVEDARTVHRALTEEEEASVSRHEIPREISEEKEVASETEVGATDASNPPVEDTTTTTTSFSLFSLTEQRPKRMWSNSRGERDITKSHLPDDSISVFEESGPSGEFGYTILLQARPQTYLSLLTNLESALDRVDELLAANKQADGVVPIIRFTSAEDTDYFTPTESFHEITEEDQFLILSMKERILKRISGFSSSRGQFCAVIKGQSRVVDFGAELLFVCHAYIFTGGPASVVGFPAISVGLFPAPAALRAISSRIGTQTTLDLLPKLHEYDLSCLVDLGMLENAQGISSSSSCDKMESNLTNSRRGTYFLNSLFARWERHIFSWIKSPRIREFLVKLHFPSYSITRSSQRPKPEEPFLKEWRKYCLSALISEDTRPCQSFYKEALSSLPFRRAASAEKYIASIFHRSLESSPPRQYIAFQGPEKSSWGTKLAALASRDRHNDNAVNTTIILDCTAKYLRDTELLLEAHRHGEFGDFKDVNVIITGDEHIAKPFLSNFTSCALVAPVYSFGMEPYRNLQQVRIFSSPTASTSSALSDGALASALGYLSLRRIPYVVCRTPCFQRILTAYFAEACRLASKFSPSEVDAIAVEMLGVSVGPFHLMDHYGSPSILTIFDQAHPYTPNIKEEQNPCTVSRTIELMCEEGFIGARGPRGGFYSYDKDGNPLSCQEEVIKRYFQHKLSNHDAAKYLLGAVINECCQLLLQGCVMSVEDVNLLAMATLGLHPITGGPFGLAESIGFSTFVDYIQFHSELHSPQLAPSPLLVEMKRSGVNFSTITQPFLDESIANLKS